MSSKKKTMSLEEFRERELPYIADVVGFGNTHQVSIYADATGVKSPELTFRGMVFSRSRLVSERYLLNYRRSSADLGLMIGVNNFQTPAAVATVAASQIVSENDPALIRLPEYDALKTPLGAVIRSRRSVRQYAGKPLSLKELSSVLFYAQGQTGTMRLNIPDTATLGDTNQLPMRATPSGGGLFPIHLYFVAFRITDLKPGVYAYVPQLHGVKRVAELPPGFDPGSLAEYGEMQVDKACLLLMYVYRVFENARKYGDLALSFALMEVGALLQNVHLTCTALGVGSCDIGGVKKRACERLLKVDGLTEHVLHLTLLGK